MIFLIFTVLVPLAVLIGGLGGVILLDLGKVEMQDRLFDFPKIILRFARSTIPRDLRGQLYDAANFPAEIDAIYDEYKKTRPITALIMAFKFSTPLIFALHRSVCIVRGQSRSTMLKVYVRSRTSGAAADRIVLRFGLTTLLCALVPTSCVALGHILDTGLAPSAMHACIALACLLTFGAHCWIGVACGTALAWLTIGEPTVSALQQTLLQMLGLALIFLLITSTKTTTKASWERRTITAYRVGFFATALIFSASVTMTPENWADSERV
jgi:hypothetical protein